MRVTFIQRPDAALACGGGEVQAEFTGKELRRLGVDVQVFTPLSTELGDLAHCFGALADFNLVADHCLQRKLPYVCSPIFYVSETRAQMLWWRAKAAVHTTYVRERRRLLDRATLLLPNSAAEARQVCSVYRQSPEKMHVTPNGVEERFASGDPELFRRTFGIQGPFVLNVARIEGRKNQLRLVRALRGTGLRLVIIGREAEPACASACRREGGDGVTILPPIPHDDPLLASAYAACRVFALPSLLETPGIAAMEAGVAGARLVTTPVGGGEEYFERHARYVDPFSVTDIRAKVRQAWSDESAGDALRDHLLGRFTWRKVAERTLEGYKRALACE